MWYNISMGRIAWNRLGDKPLTSAERQARYRIKKYAKLSGLEPILCACGCGELIPPINKQGKLAKYKVGHNPPNKDTQFKKGQDPWNKGMKGNYPYPSPNKGKLTKAESLIKRTQTRINKYGSYISPESKIKMIQNRPETWLENVIKSISERDLSGKKNPFYGKHHTEQTKKLLSDLLSGENNPNWAGGASTLPYGVGFTRKFKRLIRERDGNKCQRCGKTRKQNWRALEIHHIDHNKNNNDPSNLITVCSSCNVYLSYHRDESLQAFPKRRMLLT